MGFSPEVFPVNFYNLTNKLMYCSEREIRIVRFPRPFGERVRERGHTVPDLISGDSSGFSPVLLFVSMKTWVMEISNYVPHWEA